MKLFISSEGMVDSTKEYFKDIKQDLDDCDDISLDCPSSFAYAEYVSNLHSKIKEYANESLYIKSALKKVEKRLETLFEDNKENVDNITEIKIAEKRVISEDIV